MDTGKRDHPREYWAKIVFPSLMKFISSHEMINGEDAPLYFTFCYDESVSHHIDACAVLAIALVVDFRCQHQYRIIKTTAAAEEGNHNRDPGNKRVAYTSEKDVYRTILSEIQTVFPRINPPRRFMKELSNFFNS